MRCVRLLLVPLMITAAACGRGDGDGGLRVFAASSLTEAFTELRDQFGGGEVEFNFAGSSALAEQLEGGAEADVVATADEATMRRIEGDGNARDPKVMAHNRLEILVEKGNPKRITALTDLGRPGITFAVCGVRVPCGALAGMALNAAGVSKDPITHEENVKGVVAKVTLGEVDAGLVYATDVRAAGGTAGGVVIEPPVTTTYMIATANSRGPAQAWVAFVLSEAGQSVLEDHGFTAR